MPELVALQARLPQFESPVESQAKVLQLRQLMNADQVAGMDMQQRRQALADDAAVRQAYADNADPAARLQALAKVSPRAYQAELKSRQEADKNASEVDYKKAQARAEQLKAAHSALDAAGQVMGYVMNNPTPAAAHSALDTLERDGFYSAQDIAKYREIVNRGNADEIRQLAEQGYRSALSVKDQLPKIETRNIGGTTETDAFDPVSGVRRNLASVKNTESPDAKLSAATSRANNAATVSASLANAAATREVASATRDAAGIQRDKETEMKLADDYRAQSKPFKEVKDAYGTINSTLDKATQSPAATLAAATKFMKLLDPGSVVRESELMMALQASGVIDRAFNYFNVLQRGKVLTPTQVQDFKNITKQIYDAAKTTQQDIDENYRTQAETYGLRPNMIVQDLGQGKKPKAAAPAPALPTGWSVSVEP